jgi:ATP-dependent Clp protease ATP-binding subunit ClpX
MSHEDPPTSLRPKDNPPHARCSFCGKPRRETGPMVEGPDEIYMCVACVRAASKIADDMEKIAATPSQ